MHKIIKLRIWQKGDTLNDVLYIEFPLSNETKASTLTIYNTDIVEEYTGLIDKNGKEIYVGDIIRNRDRSSSYNFEAEQVIWSDRDLTYCASYGPLLNSEYKYEIIGNIHDNPNLISLETRLKRLK